MYYDSKSDFYIRQYGPKIGIAVLSIALIVGGFYIYFSTTQSPNTNDVVIAENENTPVIEENSLQEVVEENTEEFEESTDPVDIEISRGLTATLKNLKVLDKTDKCKVESVTDNNAVVVFLGTRYYEINLIGMDYSRSNNTLTEKIREDLVGKEVCLAFDRLRVKGGQVYGYVYLEDELSYNEYLLKNGLSIIKIETTNTSMIDKLVSAQQEAKASKLGIWAK